MHYKTMAPWVVLSLTWVGPFLYFLKSHKRYTLNIVVLLEKHTNVSLVTTLRWHLSLFSNTHLSPIMMCLTTIIQTTAQNSLSPSLSQVIRLEMIKTKLPYTTAARGLLAGYNCPDWPDSLAAVMKYS